MRLAFVHGINNQDNTPENIANTWWQALVDGWAIIGLPPKPRPRINVGYYGKILAEAVAGRRPDTVAQGGSTVSRDAALKLLRAYQAEAGIGNDELQRALAERGLAHDVFEQGLFQEALLQVASVIEDLLPGHGKRLARRYLRQASHYVEDTGLAAQINVIVRNAVFDGHNEPLLLISHSLGTVVSYSVLSDNRAAVWQVPLFMTLGSPLGIGMMQSILPPRRTIPNPPIGRWVNGYRRDDFVTLGRALGPQTLGLQGIENISDGLIEESDTHSIQAYLKSPPISGRVYAMLN